MLCFLLAENVLCNASGILSLVLFTVTFAYLALAECCVS